MPGARKPRYRFTGVFKDQPDGDCNNCIHSKYTHDGVLMCGLKTADMSNPVCLQKRAVWFLSGIDWEMERQNRDLEDGEDWKHDAEGME